MVTSYLRIYSLLENAYRRVQTEYGTFENWSGAVITKGDDDKFNSSLSQRKNLYEYMIKPYMLINESFLPANWNWQNGLTNCWPESSTDLGGQQFSSSYSGEMNHKPAVSIMSGECIVLGYMFGDFLVDLNSPKKPNALGKDQFIFNFDANNPERIKPGYIQRL